jgi:hypothetical protein
MFGASRIGMLRPAPVRRAADGDHWLVDDGHGRLHAVLTGGADLARPTAAVIPLDAGFVLRSRSAQRLWRLATGRPLGRPSDRLSQHQRKRLKLILRALDGRLAGHSYRAIAEGLFGAARVPTGLGWKTHDLRDRTIRLCRRGLELMRGGYLDLLRHRSKRRE